VVSLGVAVRGDGPALPSAWPFLRQSQRKYRPATELSNFQDPIFLGRSIYSRSLQFSTPKTGYGPVDHRRSHTDPRHASKSGPGRPAVPHCREQGVLERIRSWLPLRDAPLTGNATELSNFQAALFLRSAAGSCLTISLSSLRFPGFGIVWFLFSYILLYFLTMDL
jgi:hypothetical protein